MIATSHAARTLIILDCCHSGSFKGGGMPEALAQASGRFLLTSCRNQQLATDATEASGASAFTGHLVAALVSGEVDANEDGFVTLTEVYHYLLPKLKLATQQIPQLHLDKTVGDPPLARLRRGVRRRRPEVDAAPDPLPLRPILGLSDYKIELPEVHLNEALSPITIDVFNEGEGELNWTASSDDSWVALEASKQSFQIKLAPTRTGPHRANIYVRDAGRGGAKRVSVYVNVLGAQSKPEISVGQSSLDFGKLRVGGKADAHLIPIANRGSGELNVRAACSNPALRVSATDDFVTVEPVLAAPASLSGEIILSSRGGRASIAVTGSVEAGPLLAVKPGKVLDFGTVPANEARVERLTLANEGTGHLQWEFKQEGDFFRVEHEGSMMLRVTLALNPPDTYLGSILLKSNGGDATITVRLVVGAAGSGARPAFPPPLPVAGSAVDISGWWRSLTDKIHVTGQAPHFKYTVYEASGLIPIGRGTMTVTGNEVFAKGSSVFIPHTARYVVNGPMMSGTLQRPMEQVPLIYSRC